MQSLILLVQTVIGRRFVPKRLVQPQGYFIRRLPENTTSATQLHTFQVMTDTTSQKTFMERHLLWPKILYFSLYLAIYSANALAGPYMIQKWGITPSSAGFILALQGVNFIGAIFWTGLADKTGKHRILLSSATFIGAIMFFLHCLPRIFDWKLSVAMDMAYISTMLTIMWFFQSAMFPLLDSAMISLLSQDPAFSKDQFGIQRLFGSPAHPLASIIQALTQLAEGKTQIYLYQSIAFGAATIFAGLVLLGVPEHTKQIPKSFAHHGHKDQNKPPHLSQATALPLAPSPIVPAAPELDLQSTEKERSPVVRLLLDPGFLFFMLFVVSAGLLANSLTLFLPIHQVISKTKAKGPAAAGPAPQNSFMDAALPKLPSMVSEIAVFFTSRYLMRTFGVYWLLLGSQFFGIIRLMSYAFGPEKPPMWYSSIVEVTKGLNSGLIVSAGVRVASDIALPGCSNSAQGLFSGTYKGVSTSLAGIVGGILLTVFDQDIRRLFFWVGIFAIFTTVSFFFKFLLIDRSIGLPGMPRKEVDTHHTNASTSSFGSTTSSSTPVASTMKVGAGGKLGV